MIFAQLEYKTTYFMAVPHGNVKKILIVRIGKIGDTIITNFAFKKIREFYPNATITLVAHPMVGELLKYNTNFNKIRFFKRGLDLISLLIYIRFYKADLSFDFDDCTSGTSTLIARFGGVKHKVAFGFDRIKKYLTIPVDFPGQQESHIINRLALIVAAAGIPFEPYEVKPEITIGEKEAIQVKQHLMAQKQQFNCKIIAINISAGNQSRYWQQEKWCTLLQSITVLATRPVSFLILSLPDDVTLATEIGNSVTNSSVIYPAYRDFHSFAAYVSQSDLLISPDTSAIHIASSAAVPVIGLYFSDSWNFASWQPINTIYETIRSTTGSINSISAQQVYDAYLRLNEKISSNN